MKKFFLLLSLSLLYCCQTGEKKITAQQIIDKAIEVSNTDKVANATISFDFRDRSYKAVRDNGLYSLERITKKNDSLTIDILSNSGFKRYINNELVQVADSMAVKYSESVNSVHYFAVLPYGLNDAAVNKKLLDNSTIKGKEYYKVQITFDREGGGVDYEDVFVYWIHTKEFAIDYLAYKFHVDGGGLRFREVTSENRAEGIRFVNYNNYKPINDTRVSDLDIAFENNSLKLVSEIILKNIQVSLNN